MNERPIIFSAEMVRAILEGRKTQTRRIVKPQHFREDHGEDASGRCISAGWHPCLRLCPYGQPGDRLWVRETWDFRPWSTPENPNAVLIVYGADAEQRDATAPDGWNPVIYNYERWRPSIFMPRWASRLTLRITDVRVERLQDISGMDAKREGVSVPAHLPHDGADLDYARREYRRLWESINGPGSWDSNPWVWVIEFKRAENKA